MVCIYVSPSAGKSLDCSDSVKTTGNYASLSPPAAAMAASPKVQLLVFFSPVSLSKRPIPPECHHHNILPVGKDRM